MEFFDNLSDFQKGIFALAVGAFLVLHTLGFFGPLFTYLIIIIAILAIIYGIVATGILRKITDVFKGKK